METLLLYPVAAAVIGGVVLHFLNDLRKRKAIKLSLELEVGYLLERLRSSRKFLASDNHYWLEAGHKLTRFPTGIVDEAPVYSALLSEIYVIGVENQKRVQAFHAQRTLADQLTISLVEHIRRHKESEQPLSRGDVAVLRARRNRILEMIDEILNTCPDHETFHLEELPYSYHTPSADKVTTAIREANTSVGEAPPNKSVQSDT